MNASGWIALLPLLVTGGTAILAMLVIAIHRSHRLTLLLTLAGVAVSFASLRPAAALAPQHVTSLLVVDRFALFYIGLILAASFFVALLSFDYLERCQVAREEFYILLLLATLGAEVLAASAHFASFFLGLELLSVSLYALAAYLRTQALPLEAGIKYLVLAASSAAFLLFGMALIYAALGTMDFGEIGRRLESGLGGPPLALVLPGTVLLLTGIGFKLGVVPFHLWTPDVYQGAPAPVTAFIATVSKGSIFALLLRYFHSSGWTSAAGGGRFAGLYAVFAILAIASMLAGNLLALYQRNVKRILAYSSIAHLGYLLVAFLAAGSFAIQAVTFYFLAYFITTLGAFGVISVLAGADGEPADLAEYRGLFWRRPVIASIFTLMVLSLAGIPMTAGFLGKLYVIGAAASSAKWALVIVLAIGSTIGAFYYLRIIVALFADVPASGRAVTHAPGPFRARISVLGACTLVVLAILLLWFGIFPAPILAAIHSAAASLL